MDDIEGLYNGNVSFVNDDEPLPDVNCPRFKVRLEKVEPFTVNRRKRYRISEKQTNISQTLSNNKEKYPPEFKEYFEQNFKKQFYKTSRAINVDLKASFSRFAASLMPKALELDHADELGKPQVLKYYHNLQKSVFDKELSQEELNKFWAQLQKQKVVNAEGRVVSEELLKVNVEEWVNLTPML